MQKIGFFLVSLFILASCASSETQRAYQQEPKYCKQLAYKINAGSYNQSPHQNNAKVTAITRARWIKEYHHYGCEDD